MDELRSLISFVRNRRHSGDVVLVEDFNTPPDIPHSGSYILDALLQNHELNRIDEVWRTIDQTFAERTLTHIFAYCLCNNSQCMAIDEASSFAYRILQCFSPHAAYFTNFHTLRMEDGTVITDHVQDNCDGKCSWSFSSATSAAIDICVGIVDKSYAAIIIVSDDD